LLSVGACYLSWRLLNFSPWEEDAARDAGIPFGWVAGDEVYGGNPGLRSWLGEQGIGYVMAVACDDIVSMATGGMRADGAAGLVPKDG
jgi:hypothetical protein